MRNVTLCRMTVLVAALTLATAASTTLAGEAKDNFYRAYYLEQAKGDWAAAAELYDGVAGDRKAEADLRAQAKARLTVCREELATASFAKLMPPSTILYVELEKPGERVLRLLNTMGLLRGADEAIEDGARQIRVSPALVRELLGIRGAAVAITGIDMARQQPRGVLVFHPGNLELIRGAIETGLPIGGTLVESIGGFPTYDIEGEATVTLTSRLVVVSNQRSEIEGVINRLQGKEESSLANSPVWADAARGGDDSLLLFLVNPKPIMPMVQGMLAAGGMANRQLALAQAILDPDSLQSMMGRVAVADDGLRLELGLRLDEGHHNRVFDFLRTPAINQATLRCIPDGAAGFVIGSLNEAASRYRSAAANRGSEPIVTALDLGREVFANITSFAVFVMPSTGDSDSSGPPIPDAAIAITVNDPAKSQALWSLGLGMASFVAGAPTMAGTPETIEGVDVRSFRLPNGIQIRFATIENDVLISPSRSAMAASIAARKSGRSILDDKALASSIAALSTDTTKAVVLHAGRLATVAKRFIPPQEAKEAAPYMALLSDTVVSLFVEHSNNAFRITASLSGIPDVGQIVTQTVMHQKQHHDRQAKMKQAIRSKNWDVALSIVNGELEARPDDTGQLRRKFDILAFGQKDRDAALACGEKLIEATGNNATALNNFAWALLTEDRYADEFTDLAARASERSNKLTDSSRWAFVDTLALARFKAGDVSEATELERKAIELCGSCSGLGDLKATLARFDAAATDEHASRRAGSD